MVNEQIDSGLRKAWFLENKGVFHQVHCFSAYGYPNYFKWTWVCTANCIATSSSQAMWELGFCEGSGLTPSCTFSMKSMVALFFKGTTWRVWVATGEVCSWYKKELSCSENHQSLEQPPQGCGGVPIAVGIQDAVGQAARWAHLDLHSPPKAGCGDLQEVPSHLGCSMTQAGGSASEDSCVLLLVPYHHIWGELLLHGSTQTAPSNPSHSMVPWAKVKATFMQRLVWGASHSSIKMFYHQFYFVLHSSSH